MGNKLRARQLRRIRSVTSQLVPLDFEPALHWNWGTPLVVRDADDVPRCASNPVFCKPFMFAQEVALWRERARAPRPGPQEARNLVEQVVGQVQGMLPDGLDLALVACFWMNTGKRLLRNSELNRYLYLLAVLNRGTDAAFCFKVGVNLNSWLRFANSGHVMWVSA